MDANAFQTNRSEQVRQPKQSPSQLDLVLSFKLDHRKVVSTRPTIAHGRVSKRKLRGSLTKCLVRIRGVNFHTHPNGKCLQRLSESSTRSESSHLSLCFVLYQLQSRTQAKCNHHERSNSPSEREPSTSILISSARSSLYSLVIYSNEAFRSAMDAFV